MQEQALQSLRRSRQQDEQRCKQLSLTLSALMVLVRCAKRQRKRTSIREKKRKRIAEQILKVERNYVRDVGLFEGLRVKLMERQLLSQDESRVIFSNSKSLLELHRQILGLLEERMNGFDPRKTRLSEVLIPFVPFFQIYLEYNNSFKLGEQLIATLRRKRAALQSVIVDFEEKALTSDSFDSLRIKPVQQLTRYKLLFQSYQQHLPGSHCDRAGVSQLIAKLSKAALVNDEGLSKHQLKEVAIQLEQSIKGVVEVSRKLLHYSHCKLFGPSVQPCILFLFNDLLIVTNEQKTAQILRMTFEPESYCQQLADCKYYKNLLFVSGVQRTQLFIMSSPVQLNQMLKEFEPIPASHSERARFRSKSRSTTPPFRCTVLYAEYQHRHILAGLCIYFTLEFEQKGFRVRRKYNQDELARIFQKLAEMGVGSALAYDSADLGVLKTTLEGTQISEFRALFFHVQINNLLRHHASSFQLISQQLAIPRFVMRIDEDNQFVKARQQFEGRFWKNYKEGIRPTAKELLKYIYYKHKLRPSRKVSFRHSLEERTLKIYHASIQSTVCLTLSVANSETVQGLLLQAKNQLGLSVITDYALIYQVEGSHRKLDPDELIMDLVPEADQTQRQGIFGLIDWGLSKIFKSQQPRFLLRKWIFLPRPFEEQLLRGTCKSDNIQRMRLMAQELLWRLSRGEFDNHLTASQVAKLSASYIISADRYGSIFRPATLPLQKVRQVLTENLWSLKCEDDWRNEIAVQIIKEQEGATENNPALKLISCFPEVGWLRFDGRDIEGEQLGIELWPSKLVLLRESDSYQVRLDGLRVSCSILSIFLQYQDQQLRINLPNPHTLAEAISYMQSLKLFL